MWWSAFLLFCLWQARGLRADGGPTHQCLQLTTTHVDDYLEYNDIGFTGLEQCEYQFTYPANSAVLIWTTLKGMNASMDWVKLDSGAAGDKTYRSKQYTRNLQNTTFSWPPGGFNMTVTAGDRSTPTVSIGIRVIAGKDSNVVSSELAGETQLIPIQNISTVGTTYVFTDPSNVLFCVAMLYSINSYAYMDSSFVYSGQGPNAIYLGTLNDFVRFAVPLNATTISIYSTSEATGATGFLVITAADSISSFGSMSCSWSDSAYSIDATRGRGLSVIVTAGDPMDFPILNYIDFSDPNATLSIYATLPSNNMSNYFITNYTQSSADLMSEQLYPMSILTMTVDKGIAFPSIAQNRYADYYAWSKSDVGMHGVLYSNYYLTPQNQSHNQKYKFVTDGYDTRLKIFQFNSGSQLGSADSWINYGATNSTDPNATDSEFAWKSATAPQVNTDFTMTGRSFAIEWFGGKAPTTGESLHFQISLAPGESGSVCDGYPTVLVNTTYNFNNWFGPNSKCTYEIRFKDNYAVSMNLQSYLQSYDTVTLENRFPGGKSMTSTNSSQGFSANFPPGTAYLIVTTGNNTENTYVSLYCSVNKYPKDSTQQFSKLLDGQQPLTITEALQPNLTYVYASRTYNDFWPGGNLVMSVVSARRNVPYLDNVFVYQGDGDSAVLLGTLNDMRNRGTTVVESSVISLYPVGNAAPMPDTMIIMNSVSNLQPASPSSTSYAWSYTDSSDISTVFLNATDHPTSTSIVNSDNSTQFPIITSIKLLDPSSILTVFAGLPCSANNMTKYTITEYRNVTAPMSIPQLFPGTSVTFQLNRGTARIVYTTVKNQRNTTWGQAIIGNNGFFISDNYGFNTNINSRFSQSLSSMASDGSARLFQVMAPSNMNQGDSWMDFFMTNSTDWDQMKEINVTGPSFTDFSVVARSLRVEWSPGSQASFGQIIPFKVLAAPVATTTTAAPSTTSSQPSTPTPSTTTVTIPDVAPVTTAKALPNEVITSATSVSAEQPTPTTEAMTTAAATEGPTTTKIGVKTKFAWSLLSLLVFYVLQ